MKSNCTRNDKMVILFTRFPKAGRVKSRLIPSLGREGAAALQRRMTEHIFSILHRFCHLSHVGLEIYYDGGDEGTMKQWLGEKVRYRRQAEGDLGERMLRAFQQVRRGGATYSVLVGSDCPFIDEIVLHAAFSKLADKDMVLGPAADGGYYLIGLRKSAPAVFANITWGTRHVLAQTVTVARDIGLSLDFLDTLPDVDRPEDLSLLADLFPD